MVDYINEIIKYCEVKAPLCIVDAGTVDFLVNSGIIIGKSARAELIRREYYEALKNGEPITEVIDDLSIKYNCGTVTIRNYLKVRKASGK